MIAIKEGETKKTKFPEPLNAVLVEKKQFGKHTLAVEKMGKELSKVLVNDYSSWSKAFDRVMDKAGM